MAFVKHCHSPHRNSDRYLLDEYFMKLIAMVMRTLAHDSMLGLLPVSTLWKG